MSARFVRALQVAGVAAVVFLIVGVYNAGRNELPPPPSAGDVVAPHGGQAVGERITNRSWAVSYDRMVANADQTVVDLYGVHDGVIFKQGKPYLRVRAAHMTVNTVTHDFSATGELHVSSADSTPPRSFETESVMWTDATQKLTFAQKTTIESGAAQPLVVAHMTLNVKTGDIDIHGIDGAVRLK